MTKQDIKCLFNHHILKSGSSRITGEAITGECNNCGTLIFLSSIWGTKKDPRLSFPRYKVFGR